MPSFTYPKLAYSAFKYCAFYARTIIHIRRSIATINAMSKRFLAVNRWACAAMAADPLVLSGWNNCARADTLMIPQPLQPDQAAQKRDDP
jgi:hypothetical protein